VVSIELGDLSIDDEDQTMQVQDDMNIDEDPLPRKHMGHSAVLTNNVKPNNHTALTLKTTGGADPAGKTRAKAADYDIGTRSIIQMAIGIYCLTLLCNDPYAPRVKELEWAISAWDQACCHLQVEGIPHDPVVMKLMSISFSYIMVASWQR
jgi:hypothetical protein